ncbi:MAG: hydrogenase expression/formation protein HypE [Desulfurococcaceae archaeon]
MDRVTLAHGSGGVEMLELLENMIFRRVEDKYKRVEGGVGIDAADDGAAIPIGENRYLVVSIDSYTVNPPFFPGGNIGVLAVCGSINDVLMMGGKPIAMLDTIIVEEGFPMSSLEVIVNSMISVLREEGIALIGGDFKVMPKGQIDRIVITTAAIGVSEGKPIVDKPSPGDAIIVTDYVGDHGAVILLMQMGLGEEVEEITTGKLRSDVKPLTKLMLPLLSRYRGCIKAARDPTRGGLAGVLNEWASKTGTLILINESKVPIREAVRKYAEALGVDPLNLASEGSAVLAVEQWCADELVDFIHKLGFENARVIGEVRETNEFKGYVVAETPVGGLRVIEPPRGEIVPRIC